jgi:hypothetical protein
MPSNPSDASRGLSNDGAGASDAVGRSGVASAEEGAVDAGEGNAGAAAATPEMPAPQTTRAARAATV